MIMSAPTTDPATTLLLSDRAAGASIVGLCEFWFGPAIGFIGPESR
jgi:hypothetical protein